MAAGSHFPVLSGRQFSWTAFGVGGNQLGSLILTGFERMLEAMLGKRAGGLGVNELFGGFWVYFIKGMYLKG